MSIISVRALSIINWIQAAYAVWQFVRVAKFFKLPYAFTSSFWNAGIGATYPKKRRVVMFTFDSQVDDGFDDIPDQDHLNLVLAETYEFTSESHGTVTFKLRGVRYDFLVTRQAFHTLKLWLYYNHKGLPTVSDRAYLVRNCYYFRAKTPRECIDHIMGEHCFCVRDYMCLVDQSSTDVLNQNFLRILSIGPLVLQARNLGFESAVFSGILVLLDILNYLANQIWKSLKDYLILGVKYFFNNFPETFRLECIGVLSSGTERFRYTDDSKNKIYRKKVNEFVLILDNTFVPRGCEVKPLYEYGLIPTRYADSLAEKGRRTYWINGQLFIVEHEFCVNDRNFPCSNIIISSGTEKSRKLLTDRHTVYSVHTFLSKLRDVCLFPVTSYSDKKLYVTNPLEMLENEKYKECYVASLSAPANLTIF